MSDIRTFVDGIFDELVAIRRDIHAHPETGMRETRTAALIRSELEKMGVDEIQQPLPPAVVALIAEGENGSVPYVVAVNDSAREHGLSANDLVKQLSAAVDGRGGGKPDLAQGSGKNPAGIDAALAALRAELGRS